MGCNGESFSKGVWEILINSMESSVEKWEKKIIQRIKLLNTLKKKDLILNEHIEYLKILNIGFYIEENRERITMTKSPKVSIIIPTYNRKFDRLGCPEFFELLGNF